MVVLLLLLWPYSVLKSNKNMCNQWFLFWLYVSKNKRHITVVLDHFLFTYMLCSTNKSAAVVGRLLFVVLNRTGQQAVVSDKHIYLSL